MAKFQFAHITLFKSIKAKQNQAHSHLSETSDISKQQLTSLNVDFFIKDLESKIGNMPRAVQIK